MSPALDYSRVAKLYDSYALFTEDIPFFLGECRKVAGPVLELMSGTGRVSIPLIRAGVELTCTDRSPEMLDMLRRKLDERGLHAVILERDAKNLGFVERFTLAILPFHSFSELLSHEDQDAMLRSVRTALKPGGAFICTLHNPPVRLRSIGGGMVTVARHRAPSGQSEIILKADLTCDAKTGMVSGTQIIEECRPGCDPKPLASTPIHFSLIERDVFEALACGCGFAVDELHGDYEGGGFDRESSPYMIWTLRRL